MPACPNCGEDNSERARFCQACAAPLSFEAPTPSRVRKTVTVVFCDVTGSTSIGERLDPESVRTVMARYFGVARTALERHGGTVEKFIGDAVVAVFGIPIAHEDDALRAVRAASDLRQNLEEVNRTLQAEWGVTISIRTGVNTGQVVAGDAASGGTLATGDTMNVAARFEQSAGSGEILIGELTYQLVKDAVAVETVDPLSLKGKSSPVTAYRLIEVGPAPAGHALRLAAPMLGRDHELDLVMHAFELAATERSCRLLTVLGPAGVGKSRLVEESVAVFASEATVLRGQCLSYGEGITYWPIVQVVRQAAGISDEDAPGEAVAKIRALVVNDGDATLVTERVASLAGLADVSASAAEIFWGIRRLLETLAREQPLLLVLNDIHWAEPTLLDLIEHIASLSKEHAILLLCTARPELLEIRPRWGDDVSDAVTIHLGPLNEADAGTLIEQLLGRTMLDERVRSRIVSAAGGNPLFVEEMLSMLIDEGLLQRDDGRWISGDELSSLSIPPTISALLAARLDRLPADERRVLEPASVVGQVFYRGALVELADAEVGATIDVLLVDLSRKDLIEHDDSNFAGEQAFRFRHILIRDAAYDAMPKQLRADLHEGFATWLERVAGERVAEYEEILGYHLGRAYGLRVELRPASEADRRIAARAGGLLGNAGRRAFARADMPAAVNLLSRASSLLPAEEPARLELQPDLANALAELGQLAEADSVFTKAIGRAAALGDLHLESRARIGRLRFRSQITTEFSIKEGLRVAEGLVRTIEGLGDELGLADAWLMVAMLRFWLGESAAAATASEEAAEHARRAGDARMEAQSLSWLGLAVWYGPVPVTNALEKLDEIMRRAQGHPEVEARVVCVRANFLAMLGRFEEARETILRGRAMYEDLGLILDMAGMVPIISCSIERLAGDMAAAERHLRWGFDILEKMGEKGFLSSVAALLADVIFAQGREQEASEFAEIARAAASEGDMLTDIFLRNTQAQLLSSAGDFAEAEAMSRDAVRLAGTTDWSDLHGDTLLILADVLAQAGSLEEALRRTQEAEDRYESKGNAVSKARARRLARELADR